MSNGRSALLTVLRLVLLSIAVGVVLSALGIRPIDLLDHLRLLIERLRWVGFDAVRWMFDYFVVGAVIVIPIWLLVRLLGVGRNRAERDRRRD